MLRTPSRPARPPLSSIVAGLALVVAALLVTRPAAATPCGLPTDCPSGLCVDAVCCDTKCKAPCEACSAALKGSGVDGTCGFVPQGTICAAATCDASLSFIGEGHCDASNVCVTPPPVSCLQGNPCKFDLCGSNGCESVTKLDGTACGDKMTCQGAACAPTGPTSSAASSASGSGAGGGGVGATTGSGGASGKGGGAASSGAGDPYPPAQVTGCACRTTGDPGGGAVAAVALSLVTLIGRRRMIRR